MKNFIPLLIAIVFTCNLSIAQLSQSHLISSSHPEPTECVVADFDADGDNDIVIFESDQNRLILFKNSNGLGDFNFSAVISNISSISELKTEDMDDDGDLDILCIQGNSVFKSLFWFENKEQGNDWEEHALDYMGDVGLASTLVDVDKDGDLDLLSANLGWFEQMDATISFGDENIVLNDVQIMGDIQSIYPTDFDHDGDLDLVIYSRFSQDESKIYWLERQGQSVSFLEPQILVNSLSYFPLSSLRLADIDLDMDLDILIHLGAHDVWLYKNDSGIFPTADMISEYFDVPGGVAVTDVNHDGYFDFFWCGHSGIYWAENNRMGGFISEIHRLGPIQSNMAVKNICFADLDGDSDKDLLSLGFEVSGFAQQIRWYENEFPIEVLSNKEHHSDQLKIFPNPASNGTIIIDGISVKKGFIYDLNGREMLTFNSHNIDIQNLATGFYILKVQGLKGKSLSKKVMIIN